MGPSGAGKDSVLRYARERLAGSGVLFAHRYITRPPVAGDENFVSLDPAEFAARRARGLFAFDWEAHGCLYGIGLEIEAWLERAALPCDAGVTIDNSGPLAEAGEALVGLLAGRGRGGSAA